MKPSIEALKAFIESLEATHAAREFSDGERERADRTAHIAFLKADLAEREVS